MSRAQIKRLESLEGKIASHTSNACDACTDSVTKFSRVCPVLADLMAQARKAVR